MRVPYTWLREHCDPGLSAEELAERLSMTGTEVERVGHVGAPSAEGFVVGRVLAVEGHPNADRLTVCEVDTGDGTRTIVCGAPNVAAGQAVPVALPGAVLPDGRELGRAKLRGVVSDGMILSEAELQIGEDEDGIMVLGDGAAPGTPLTEVLPVAEPVLELEVTPNRPDCLGIYGVAREVHAITGAPLAAPPWEEDAQATGEGTVEDYASVTIEVPDLCPRFTARVFTDVGMGPSPPWMKARLVAAGQRPISNVVDVTNYAMLLTGQPLHAFDLDLVPDGALIVRTAVDGETLTTLDGEQRVFDSESVLVCDRNGPSGIAGIMGGQVSEVSESTTRVLLEVATWNGVNILRTSSLLGLRSEASTRFEKQLHPELAMRAQRVAAGLIVELARARLVPGTIDVAVEPPAPHVISLAGARVEALLGMRIEPDEQVTHLERLGFAVERDGDALTVTVPPDRHYDVSREADVIEEVARVHGLDEHLPATLPLHGQRGRLSRDQALRRQAEDVLRDLGFDEVIAWSFVSPDLPDRLRLGGDDPRRAAVAVLNPLSEEQSVMRTTLLGGLLDAARHNLARHADRVALFESGRVYLRQPAPSTGGVVAGDFVGERPAPVAEPHRIGCLAVGPLVPPSWRDPAAPADAAGYFELKGVLEALCGRLGVEARLEPAREPFLHPGRAAAVEVDGVTAGWLGELHPRVARDWELPGGTAFELDVAPLFAAAADDRQYEDLTTFPALYEDIALALPDEVPAERVRQMVLEAGGELLRSARVFDLYRGEQVGEGRKSLALRLEFRADDRTLTDAEVAERRQAIKRALEAIGGALRE
jgi:phenylalanyl-tRNA synthetase beta chain